MTSCQPLEENGIIAPVGPNPSRSARLAACGLQHHNRGDEIESTRRPDAGDSGAAGSGSPGLSEASLHITEDLDLDAVLQGVLDGARSLTGARMGGVTILDDDRTALQDFITSGMADEDHQRFVDLPGGPEFFAYLSSLPEPLRLADFSAHTRRRWICPRSARPWGRWARLFGRAHPSPGAYAPATSIYRTRRAEGSSPRMTRRPWLMFASQAAMAIANARRHREEQRARAYLETLDRHLVRWGSWCSTPKTGVPVVPQQGGEKDGRRPAQNPGPDGGAAPSDVLTFRRADGREISLREFPLAEALSTGETVRAEEIVMRRPRRPERLRACINATRHPLGGRTRWSRWSSPSRT